MKKVLIAALYVVLFLIISSGVVWGCLYAYENSADFQSLFGVSSPDVLGPTTSAKSLAARGERAGRVALYIFTGIIVVQVLVLFIAIAVLNSIRKCAAPAKIKLAKLANADIFLDLPLYIGLFGSVSSFMVMSFSSTSGQLIAYSSTLIGIIFCTVLRVFLLYPIKSKLISSEQTVQE